MRVLVAGLGVQGKKRAVVAGSDLVGTVDPFNPEANFRRVADVPLSSFDAVLVCTPDEPKIDIVSLCLNNAKHILVEKPFSAAQTHQISALERLAHQKKVLCYTAYNHRFEPNFIKMKQLIDSGELGSIYSCRMFYGNGTARLVRDSVWRDRGTGVLSDLGSHLLDTCRFWFGPRFDDFQLGSYHRFENMAPDHVVIQSENTVPRFELEMTLCMWRNHFTCDILAEKGTAHIESLCKWGPSSFIFRKRVLPSGRPVEYRETLVQPDPTWEAEYKFFKRGVKEGRQTDLATDLWLHRTLHRMASNIYD